MAMPLPKSTFRHLGINCFKLDPMVAFYQRWFGLVVVDRAIGSTGDEVAFMTADPHEHHQIVIATGRKSDAPQLNQVSFEVPTLGELIGLTRAFHREGVRILQQKDHGNAWSVYVADPENNRLEIYTHSPWHIDQAIWWPLDMLTETEEQIFERTKAKAQSWPNYMTREQWQAKIARQIEEARAAHSI